MEERTQNKYGNKAGLSFSGHIEPGSKREGFSPLYVSCLKRSYEEQLGFNEMKRRDLKEDTKQDRCHWVEISR